MKGEGCEHVGQEGRGTLKDPKENVSKSRNASMNGLDSARRWPRLGSMRFWCLSYVEPCAIVCQVSWKVTGVTK